MSKPPELDRNQDATCYVGNLDDRATDALVWELMIQAGPIVNVHLPKDRVTQAHQGYGFAEFQTEEDAEYACKIMNGIKLYGKPLRVNKASSDKKQIDIGANLFVGNLDVNADERTLFDAFSNFGPVVGLPNIARDPTTGVSKGYGFVSFDSFEAADAAIESLDNQYLLNRPIHVDYALKKDGKGGERHGTAAERLLAAQARKNNVMPVRAPMGGPPAFGAPGQGWFGAPQGGPIPPPPPPGFGGAPPLMAGMVPPPPPGFAAAANGVPAYSGPPPGAPLNGIAPPPPGFEGQAPTYGGPPPPAFPPIQYAGPPPGMTGSNNAPLGPRRG